MAQNCLVYNLLLNPYEGSKNRPKNKINEYFNRHGAFPFFPLLILFPNGNEWLFFVVSYFLKKYSLVRINKSWFLLAF